eukprot:5212625-Amphidinium_carterae.1
MHSGLQRMWPDVFNAPSVLSHWGPSCHASQICVGLEVTAATEQEVEQPSQEVQSLCVARYEKNLTHRPRDIPLQ